MKSLKNTRKKFVGLLVAGAVVATVIVNGNTPKASANADSATVQGRNINSFCVEGAGTGQDFDAANWTFKTIAEGTLSNQYLDSEHMEEKLVDKKFCTGIVGNIHSENRESVIRLINGMEYEDMSNVGNDVRSGYAMLEKPVKLDSDSRFSAKFTFSMPEATCYDGYTKGAGGDGIVFVITTDEELNGLSGGAIGYKGITNSLGIELDSFYNTGNGQGYYDPTYDEQYKDYRKDHVAVVLNGQNTTVDNHIATSFLYESGYLDGFTQEGSLTTYGEECDTRLFTVWVEYDGEDLYVSYAKGDYVNAVRPTEAQIVVDGSEDARVKEQLEKFANQEVKVGFTSAIGSSKANHTIHSVALVNEYVEGGLQTTYMEKYYVESPDAADDTEELVVVDGKKYVLVKTNLVLDAVVGADVEVTDLQDVYAVGYSVTDYSEQGYPSTATVAADGSTVVNQFFSHDHIWEYEVEDNKITAECEDDNCDINEEEISIVIIAEDEYYTGNPYSSAEIEDKLTDITGDEESVIYYEGVLEDGSIYEKTTVPPTEVGTYIASVTVGNVTAEDPFNIWPVEDTDVEDEVEEDNNNDEVVEEDNNNDEVVEEDNNNDEVVEEDNNNDEVVEEDNNDNDEVVEEDNNNNDEVVEKDNNDETVVEDEEDVVVEVPEAAPSVDEDDNDTTEEESEETVVEEEEEDIDLEVPEAAPGVDADAQTGDSSNLVVLFVVMLASALGLLVSRKLKTSLNK